MLVLTNNLLPDVCIVLNGTDLDGRIGGVVCLHRHLFPSLVRKASGKMQIPIELP
jgi:hypothetical protein